MSLRPPYVVCTSCYELPFDRLRANGHIFRGHQFTSVRAEHFDKLSTGFVEA